MLHQELDVVLHGDILGAEKVKNVLTIQEA